MSPPTSSRSAPGPPAGSEDRFRRLYADVRDDVQRFVLRRCDPAEADDVVAETFTTVWRRIADLPDHLGDQRAVAAEPGGRRSRSGSPRSRHGPPATNPLMRRRSSTCAAPGRGSRRDTRRPSPSPPGTT
ncbi:RNA polymerase sigma factor [Ornithinimicrobium sp. Y1694]|uniref:RNA polymerase sigma factor n=1 Tax=Ornithinimicrobium sp. Y1694 TaxID=3418590 RepID=UPI003CF0C0BC